MTQQNLLNMLFTHRGPNLINNIPTQTYRPTGFKNVKNFELKHKCFIDGNHSIGNSDTVGPRY